ncbi:uncharacterized protein LOC115888882 [Sitophilus oryzae]|uniref:Uncharacterized protein LOC115888882 n=1 Tax=Sitophilus oryzae TaxID=7048 RepID=A0A6J2YPA5_SITOR|nr:uncharacterized protein LOC115888882 [Sitophilus oryzae]
MVSFDVVSLFTRAPLGESMALIKESFTPAIAELFRVCLTGSYFLGNGNYYEQTDGAAMGSPISPIIANFFMERFVEKALESSVLKPAVRFRYVDDTFVVWKHGRDSPDDFLHHLNSQSPGNFTMETEVSNQLVVRFIYHGNRSKQPTGLPRCACQQKWRPFRSHGVSKTHSYRPVLTQTIKSPSKPKTRDYRIISK